MMRAYEDRGNLSCDHRAGAHSGKPAAECFSVGRAVSSGENVGECFGRTQRSGRKGRVFGVETERGQKRTHRFLSAFQVYRGCPLSDGSRKMLAGAFIGHYLICAPMKDFGQANPVVRYAESPLPTRHGIVRLVVFREVVDGRIDPDREHIAMVIGEPEEEEVLCRVHSECITSEVFGSLKCDCRDQLEQAVAEMHEEGAGVFLYLRQEGRGIGLGNKIRAYALQAEGADTIQANHQLGFETDLRTYDIAAGMLKHLGVRSVRLLTNNPAKIRGLEENGVEVHERLQIQLKANSHSAGYLKTKRDTLGHLLGPIS